MLKNDVQQALNAQIDMELAASHQYLAMAAYFETLNLTGFASFMRRQSDEERTHAMRIFNFVLDRGGEVKLGGIAAAGSEFASPRAAFEAALQRERDNSASINKLYRLAREQDDYATQTMLEWFIDEQVEEEKWATENVTLLDMAGEDKSALLMLDRQVGERSSADAGDAE